jgi:hypothetical protein
MRTTLKISLAVLVVLTMVSTTALSQSGNRVGTNGADQILVPVGARGIALGSSFLAGISGVEAIYYNPAGLGATTSSAEASFSQMNSIGGVGVSYLALGGNFAGFGTLGFSVKAHSFGDIAVTDERNPDGTGATYAPAFVTIGLTYARSLTDRIRAGVSCYLISETIDRTSASAVSFDVGIQYHGLAGLKGLQLGVALRHIGSDIKYEGSGLNRSADEVNSKRSAQILKIDAAGVTLPTSLELGVAYNHHFNEQHGITVAGAFENNNFLTDQFRLGLEYSFQDMLFLRGSYNIAGQSGKDAFDESAYIYGPAFGAGVKYEFSSIRLGVDYAYRVSEYFDGNHVVTVNVGF